MSHIDFYYIESCPSCRSVMLTARAIGLECNMKRLDLSAGEHLKPEFLAINPQHCIPTIVDGPLILWESRAICTYLISKYGPEDELYPKDPVQRAHIDRLMQFDMGTLYRSFVDYYLPVRTRKVDKPSEEKLNKIQEALGYLDGYLKDQFFAMGSTLTVADFVLVATVESIVALDVDLGKHANVKSWLDRCRNHMKDYKECNAVGAAMMGANFRAALEKRSPQ